MNVPLQCEREVFFGWKCTRGYHGVGPCALVPRWRNLIGLAVAWKNYRWTRKHGGRN